MNYKYSKLSQQPQPHQDHLTAPTTFTQKKPPTSYPTFSNPESKTDTSSSKSNSNSEIPLLHSAFTISTLIIHMHHPWRYLFEESPSLSCPLPLFLPLRCFFDNCRQIKLIEANSESSAFTSVLGLFVLNERRRARSTRISVAIVQTWFVTQKATWPEPPATCSKRGVRETSSLDLRCV